MPDREVAGRHPFHPALVHFPIACWGLSHPADLAALLGAQVVFFGLDWWALSCLLVWAGVVSAVPAMAVGIYDFMQLPDEDRLMQAFYKHAGFVGTAWILYLASGYTRLAGNLGSGAARVTAGCYLRHGTDMSLYRRVVWRTDGIQISPGLKSRRVMGP